MESILSEQFGAESARRHIPFIRPGLRLWSDPLGYFTDLSRSQRDLVGLRLGFQKIFFVNHPDHIRHIFRENRDNYVKSKYYRKLMPLLGNGLFTSEGEIWRKQRSIAQPAFSGARLKEMVGQVVVAVESMLERWDRYERQGIAVDVSREATGLALDVVLRCLFGIRFSKDVAATFDDALTTLLLEGERRIWSPNPLSGLMPTARNIRFRAALRTLDRIVYKLIDEERQKKLPSSDLFARLLVGAEARGWSPATRKLLRDEVLSLIVAGHETTANALGWTWYQLGRNPEIERTLAREAQNVLGNRPPTFEDIERLTFAKCVFQESLRLYPPVWTFSRQALRPDRLGKIEIPAGAVLMVCAYTMHRHPDYWDKPGNFEPCRFAAENTSARDQFLYFPFGGGQRVCLGNRFAMMEALVALSMVSRAFRLEPVDGQEIKPQAMVTIRPQKGSQMRLTRREPADQVKLASIRAA